MSFKGEFKVAGTTYSIIQGSIPLKQKYNQKGTPSSGVHSGKIKLILEGTNDGTLGNWMSDPTKKQDGKLIFYRTDQDSTFKVIEFEGGYIIDLIEHFTIDFAISESLTSKEDTISIDLSKTDSEDMKTLSKISNSYWPVNAVQA